MTANRTATCTSSVVLTRNTTRGVPAPGSLARSQRYFSIRSGSLTTTFIGQRVDEPRRVGPAQLRGAHPGTPLSPALVIPARAADSSLSDVSPEMPTAPTSAPSSSLTRTPPGTGTKAPTDRLTAAMK
jgi:hypothetical protein